MTRWWGSPGDASRKLHPSPDASGKPQGQVRLRNLNRPQASHIFKGSDGWIPGLQTPQAAVEYDPKVIRAICVSNKASNVVHSLAHRWSEHWANTWPTATCSRRTRVYCGAAPTLRPVSNRGLDAYNSTNSRNTDKTQCRSWGSPPKRPGSPAAVWDNRKPPS